MTIHWIDWYNAITYSTALLLVLSSRIRASRWRYVLCFIALVVFQVLIGTNNYYATLINLFFVGFCFFQRKQGWPRLYECLCSISIIAVGIALFSCLRMLLFPHNANDSTAFNIAIGLLLLLIGVVWKVAVHWQRKRLWRESVGFAAALQILPLLFYTFVLPNIVFSDPRHLATMVLFFLGFLFLVNVLLAQLRKQKHANQMLLLQREHEEDIKRYYEQSIEREHYFRQLFETLRSYVDKADAEELKHYFYDTISPIFKYPVQPIDIDLIQSPLLRHLTQNELQKLSSVKGAIVDAEFSGDLRIDKRIEADLFKILAECFANARKAVAGQKRMYIQVHFIERNGKISFKIANSIAQSISDCRDVVREKRGGLQMIQRIVHRNKDTFAHSYYVRAMLYDEWRLFVQEIIVDCAGGNHAG